MINEVWQEKPTIMHLADVRIAFHSQISWAQSLWEVMPHDYLCHFGYLFPHMQNAAQVRSSRHPFQTPRP